MDPKEFAAQVVAWEPGFLQRFPGKITEAARGWVLPLICMIDLSHQQRFAVDSSGAPLFAVKELAYAFGMDDLVMAGLLVNWELSLGGEYLIRMWVIPGDEPELWVRFGGLILAVASLQLYQLPEPNKDDLIWLTRVQTVISTLGREIGATPDETQKWDLLIGPG